MSGALLDRYYELNSASQYAILQSLLIRSLIPILNKTGGADNPNFEKIINFQNDNENPLLNKLHWVDGAFELMRLTPDKISQLVPTIRLYKVIYDSDGKPSEEIEYTVNATLSAEQILAQANAHGYGIKNFQYKYIGSNPATVRNDIEAKMTLYFQSFSQILQTRTVKKGGKDYKWAFLDLFERARKTKAGIKPNNKTQVNEARLKKTDNAKTFADKLADCAEKPDPRDVYNGPIEFEVKAVVGWAPLTTNNTFTQAEIRALKSCTQAFFLTLIDHEINFNDEGNITVELNYRARLGGILDSPQLDILRLDNILAGYRTGGAGKAKFYSEIWLRDSGLEEVYEGTPEQIIDTLKQELKKARNCCDQEAISFINNRLQLLYNNMRTFRYRKIIDTLITNKKVRTFKVATVTLNRWAQAEGENLGGEAAGRSSEVTTVIDARRELVEELDGLSSGTSPTLTSRIGTVAGFDIDDDTDKRLQAWNEFLEPDEPNEYDFKRINYFFFGDMLELVAKSAMISSTGDAIDQAELNRIKIMLGKINISGVLRPETSRQITQPVQLSNVPISIELFKNFWFKKVIKAKRDRYPLIQFIRDCVRELIFGSINSVYYTGDGKLARNKTKLLTAHLSLPAVKEDGVLTDPIEEQLGDDRILDISPFTKQNPLTTTISTEATNNHYHYLVIGPQASGIESFKRKKVKEKGLSRRAYNERILNVHNFGFGEDRGMLKKMSFSKVDQTHLRESRYLEYGNNPWIQLANVYKVNITAFGAPFFFPGQYIYVDPLGLDPGRRLGQPDSPPPTNNPEGGSFSNLMGIGGYHIIIDVEGIIEDGKYEMSMNSLFDNSGADAGERFAFGRRELDDCSDNEDE